MGSPRDDRATQQVDDLVNSRYQGHVSETPLYFCPFVTNFAAQSGRILFKRLMKNANDDKATIASCSRLGQFLKEVNVAALSSSAFEEFAKLVDHEQDAVARTRGRFLYKPLDEFATRLHFAPWPTSVGAVPAPRLLERVRNVGNGIAAATNDGNDKPSLLGWLKRS
jgi:hypothetical protein